MINKNYLFIVLNTLVVPIMNLTVILSFLKAEDESAAKRFLFRVSNSTEFILRYIIQVTFLSNTIQIVLVPCWVRGKFSRWDKDLYSE